MARVATGRHSDGLRSSLLEDSDKDKELLLTPAPCRSRPGSHNLNSNATGVESSPTSALISRLANMSLRDYDEGFEAIGSCTSDFRSSIAPSSSSCNGLSVQPSAAQASIDSRHQAAQATIVSLDENEARPVSSMSGPSRKPESKDELSMRLTLSRIRELSTAIQEVDTTIFEIQELRHTASSAQTPQAYNASSHDNTDRHSTAAEISSTSLEAGSVGGHLLQLDGTTSVLEANAGGHTYDAISDVDAALMRLHAQLKLVASQFVEIEVHASLNATGGASATEGNVPSLEALIRSRWRDALADWKRAQTDAHVLGEELKEDKWLVVFRTVSQQAEDMMRSLEKAISQSHQFVWDVNRRNLSHGSTSQASLASFHSASGGPRTPAGRNLGPGKAHANATAFYSSDLSQEDDLRTSFVALHRSLLAKVKYYSPACDRVINILSKGIADRHTKNGEVLHRFAEMKARWKNLLERIGRIEAEMQGVEETFRNTANPDLADEAAAATSSFSLTPATGADTNGKRELSLAVRHAEQGPSRRTSRATTPSEPLSREVLDRRIHRSTGSQRPPVPERPATSTGFSSATRLSDGTPRRPPRSPRRVLKQGVAPHLAASTPQSLSHRHSLSTMSAMLPTPPPVNTSRRAPSPAFSASAHDKPRWNISTRRTQEPERLLHGPIEQRPSFIASEGLTANFQSASGRRQSSSRLSTTLSRSLQGCRPVSPAWSEASSSFVRERTATPSRIPGPAAAMRLFASPSASGSVAGDTQDTIEVLARVTADKTTMLGINTDSLRPAGPSFSATSSAYCRLQPPEPKMTEPKIIVKEDRMSHVLLPYNAETRKSPTSVINNTPESRGKLMAAAPQARIRKDEFRVRRPSILLSSSQQWHGGTFSSQPPSGVALAATAGSSLLPLFRPNLHDPLDLSIARVLEGLPFTLQCQRVDAPYTNAQMAHIEIFQAKYRFYVASVPTESVGNDSISGGGDNTGGGRSDIDDEVQESLKESLSRPSHAHHLLSENKHKPMTVTCKLVDRIGPRASLAGAAAFTTATTAMTTGGPKWDKKVVVRVATGWQNLDIFASELKASVYSSRPIT